MKKVTRWHPDTCSCMIEYEWDTDDPQETRVHTPVHSKSCQHHQQHEGNHHGLFNAVMEENVRKNHSLAALLEQQPDLDINLVKFRFDEQRKLVISHPSLTGGNRAMVHTNLQKQFGDDVRVE